MVALGDPVGTKLVDSLGRPGGNITGMSQMTSGLAAKRLELLKEAVPELSRVLVLAYLVDPISPLQVQAMKETASSLGVTLQVIDIKTPDDLPAAFEAGSKVGAQGVLTTAESIFRDARARVTELAARYSLPAIYPWRLLPLARSREIAYPVTTIAIGSAISSGGHAFGHVCECSQSPPKAARGRRWRLDSGSFRGGVSAPHRLGRRHL
jgi:hypothetical protein